MEKFKTIVLTGGGTAGHVTVNINLKEALEKHFENIIYIGRENGIEKELITKKTNYKYYAIPTVKFYRNSILKNIALPVKLIKSVNLAKKLLKEIKPDAIFSKGGYVGLPVILAGKSLKIPVVCHESDMSLGMSNKLAKPFASAICTNFKQTAKTCGEIGVYSGMPLNLSTLSKQEAKQKLSINTNKPILLITGGSLGSITLNKFTFNNIHELVKTFYVLHLVGKNNKNEKIIEKDYKQIEFTYDMPTIMKASDFALSRSGANSIIELLSNNILTIFVPLSKDVSRGDQIENAKYFSEHKMSEMILQENLNFKNFMGKYNLLKENQNKIYQNILKENISDGTDKIIITILNSIKKSRK